MTFALFNCCFVPIQVSFSPESLNSTGFYMANYFIDFFFLLDILVNFRTVYIDDKGQEVKQLKDIAKFYVKRAFFIDILATVPFDDILQISSEYKAYIKELQETKQSQWI